MSNEVEKEYCAICLEELSEQKTICTTECLHKFHTKCFETNLRKSINCPICRFNIRSYICADGTKSAMSIYEQYESSEDLFFRRLPEIFQRDFIEWPRDQSIRMVNGFPINQPIQFPVSMEGQISSSESYESSFNDDESLQSEGGQIDEQQSPLGDLPSGFYPSDVSSLGSIPSGFLSMDEEL